MREASSDEVYPRPGEWRPVTRLLMGTAGGLLAVRGIRRGGASGAVLSALGAGLVSRSVTGHLSGWTGRRDRGPVVHLEKTLTVGAPLEAVWNLWSNFENFPRFLTHLREVRKIDEGHSHWIAGGPATAPVEWDTAVTDWVPRQFIGWRSHEEAPLRTSGQVRFRRTGDNQTEIDLQLIYTPAAASEHAVAAMLGAEPTQSLSDDLGRMQSLLEAAKPKGTPAVEAGAVNLPRRTRRGRPKRKS
jgi:uncharacterized membrane protein